ncbi:MAG: hypothetical protein KQA33_01320 [Candidatus Aenigmarchaeota archaeon]|nr:hypothetical protein [Candidatus Aenigmarchaeota archaeon]
MEKIISAIQGLPAMVFDIDRTLHRSTVTVAIGRAFRQRERAAGRTLNFYSKMFASAFANTPFLGPRWDHNHTGLKAGGIKWGIRTLFDALAKAGISKAEIYRMAAKHIAAAAIPQTHELLKAAIANRALIFLTTTGTEIGPILYSKKYNVTAWLGNPVQYEGNRVAGCQINIGPHNITSSIERMLQSYGLHLDECAIIADDNYYIPAMRKAAVSIASPLARRAVQANAAFCL